MTHTPAPEPYNAPDMPLCEIVDPTPGRSYAARISLGALLLLLCACHPVPALMPLCWEGDRVASYEGACALPEPVVWDHTPITYYTEASGFRRRGTVAAAELWNQATGLVLLVETRTLPADVVVVFGGTERRGSAATVIYRDGEKLRAAIQCRRCAMVGQTTDLLGHEFGHVLGLAHDLKRDSIMHSQPPHPLRPRRRSVQRSDRVVLRQIYGGTL